MQRYRWEFFVINSGSSNFKGAGTSLKKTSTNVQRQGTVFKIYGCGYLMPRGTDLDDIDDPEILIPLESVIILSSWAQNGYIWQNLPFIIFIESIILDNENFF